MFCLSCDIASGNYIVICSTFVINDKLVLLLVNLVCIFSNVM